MNDIVTNKVQSIQRCVERAREEYSKNPDGFDSDYTIQDAAVLNILRACEQAIDLANHIIKLYKMGIPNSSGDSFDLLNKKNVIDTTTAENLKKMVRFRNTIVHEYRRMNVEIARSIIKNNLSDIVFFADKIMEYIRDNPL